jgi:hypothetical protein
MGRNVNMRKGLSLLTFCIFIAGVAFADQKAVPPGTATFIDENGNQCTALFSRSGSGIVSETQRTCSPHQFSTWLDASVYLQFRPVAGGPNARCDPARLVTPPYPWTNSDPAISKWLPIGTQYNVCVYLVNPVVASGTIFSWLPDGTTTPLPIAGTYNVCVTGTIGYSQGMGVVADAGYLSYDNWVSSLSLYLTYNLSAVQIDGAVVNWGAYNPSHGYCINLSHGATPVNLRVYDTYYDDNSGSLEFTIKYVGLN